MNISQMQQAMGPAQTPTQPANTMTIAQMHQIMQTGSLSPNASAQAFGHSNTILSNFINGAENLLPTAGAIAGGIGGAAAGGLAGIETGPGAIATGYAGGVAGSGAGAAAGEALKEKLQGQDLNPNEIGKQGILNAAFEGIGGPILSAGGKVLERFASPVLKTGGKVISKVADMFGAKPVAEQVVKPPVKLATSRLASTAETMTKAERESAIKEGRMTTSGKYTPSKTEQRAGEIMQGKTFSNPVKTTRAIQKEIGTRGQAAETHLEQNVRPISNEEDFNAFQSARTSSEKYMTPSETSAYDEQVGVFQKILKSYTGNGGYNTANYYKALKDYESQVTANLAKGKDALLVPGGSARIQGAKDVRQVVRDMIGEKNPEFKGEMYDLASLYDSLDNVVANAEKGGHSLTKRYPKAAAAITTGAGILGAEELKGQVDKFLGN